MSDDDDDDITDATTLGTCHCDLCGASLVLAFGLDYVVIDHDEPGDGYSQSLQFQVCCGCARKVHDAYRSNLRAAGICEHGVEGGEWCEDCHQEYKRARIAEGDGTDEEGDW